MQGHYGESWEAAHLRGGEDPHLIGTRLHTLIHAVTPELAVKITGILLASRLTNSRTQKFRMCILCQEISAI